MKFLQTLISLLLMVPVLYSQDVPVEGNWEITFFDDFELEHLDPLKWKHGGGALYTNGMAANVDNAWTEDGILHIKSEKRDEIFAGLNYHYASSELSTFRKFRQVYGYIEARVKYDPVTGAWPAFWLMPDRGMRGDENHAKETYMKFEIDTTLDIVSQALFRVKVKNRSSDGKANVSIHKLLDDNWEEESLTWSNRPVFDPIYLKQYTYTGTSGEVNQIFTGEYLELDVTNYVNKCLEENHQPGFALVDKFMRAVELEFYSKEATIVADRPELAMDGVVYLPSDDTYVRGGNYADSNYGSESNLLLNDPWVSTTSTFDGGMEMDILESLGIWGADQNQNAIHWDGYQDEHKSTGSGTYSFDPTPDGFHTYGVYWVPGKLEFYVDHKKMWEYKSSRVASVAAHLILTFQVGGWNGNTNPDDSSFPAEMQVDYVKVYKDLLGARIRFTNLEEGMLIPENSTITLDTEALEYGGEITEVDFFHNGERIYTDNNYPYSFNATEVLRGNHEFVVKAGNSDNTLLSADTIQLVVGDPPEVSISSPQSGDRKIAPADFQILVEAVSYTGSIEHVDLLLDGDIIQTTATEPFEFDVNHLRPGNYPFTVIAYDELGLSVETEVLELIVDGGAVLSPWKTWYVGNSGESFKAGYYEESFIMEASGKDLSSKTDKQLLVYQLMRGNGEIIARLRELDPDNDISSAGIIFRNSLMPGARMAAISITAGKGSQFLFRTAEGNISVPYMPLDGITAPVWLKLTRDDNTYSGYISQDTVIWTRIFNPIDIDMQEDIIVGMFIYSNADGPSKGIIDSVFLKGNYFENEDPVVSISSETIADPPGIQFEITASDPDGGNIEKVEIIEGENNVLTTFYQAPYTYEWSLPAEGIYLVHAYATDTEGSSSESSEIQVSVNATGMGALFGEKPSDILYPVPADDIIFGRLGSISLKNVTVALYDIEGKCLRKLTIDPQGFSFAVSDLDPGVYYLEVNSGRSIETIPFMIQ